MIEEIRAALPRLDALSKSLLLLIAGLLSSCGGESLEDEYRDDRCEALFGFNDSSFQVPYTPYTPNTSSPVTDSTGLPAAITFENARLVSGSIPIPDLGVLPDGSPSLSLPTSVTITDNSSTIIRVQPTNLPSGFSISAVFVQFAGDSEYFLIPIDPTAAQNYAAGIAARAAAGQVTQAEADDAQSFADSGGVLITLQGPTTTPDSPVITGTTAGDVVANTTLSVAAFLIPTGSASPDYSQNTWDNITDTSRWVGLVNMGARAVFVGAGVLQASLTWATGLTTGTASDAGAVDLDLYVTEPDSETIFYGNTTSDNGGELDVDNRLGFGPENIRYQNTPPDGVYRVELEYYDAGGDTGLVTTPWSIAVTACNSLKTYTGLVTQKSVRTLAVEFTLGPNCVLPEPNPVPAGDDVPTPSVWEQAALCDDNRTE